VPDPRVLAVRVPLLMQPRALLTREPLLDAVWGPRFVTASTLKRVIALARRAFADDAGGPRYLQMVYASGYRSIGLSVYRSIGPIEKTAPALQASRANSIHSRFNQ
jgi:DNA-binding winged helix-turn-helix (wHTH) protein